MYDFIQGELVSKSPSEVVLLAGGIGYLLYVPVSTYERLTSKGPVQLFTHFYVREDAQRLYGFASREERDLFRLLNTVSTVGPDKALKLLSSLPAAELRRAVAANDVTLLSRVKGIGRKTAERISIELRDKMEAVAAPAAEGVGVGGAWEAIAGLMTLGYKRSEAQQAVEKAAKAIGADAPLELMIREALRHV
jgi:holliday junction DNA helicase RuvA